MSFIQFESAREKEAARNELRQVREEMLDQAKRRAEQRAEREANKELKGEMNWILPSVEEKLKKKFKEAKKSKKKKEKKKSKKSKKKSSKKGKHSSSVDECDSSETHSTTDNGDSSSSEDEGKRRKRSTKSKKKRKSKSKRKHSISSDLEADTKKNEWVAVEKSETPLQRDSWMTDSLMLKTYSRERANNKPNEKQNDTYDPAKSSRELNPHWKTTGTGLPAFRKPQHEDIFTRTGKSSISCSISSSKNWRKKNNVKESSSKESRQIAGIKSPSPSDEPSSCEENLKEIKKEKPKLSTSEFLTDQQLNELGAKIFKAEILGNMSLAEELREKLENARLHRNVFKERKKTEFLEVDCKPYDNKKPKLSKNEEEHVLLTHTDQSGQTRPLPSAKAVDPRDMYGGKKKQKRVKTHDDSGQRVRYFADDDRYDIKQMFESEKYTTASEANLQFADMAGKHKNPNDDLEDIFAEKACQDDSARSDRKNRDRAIREHQKMETALDKCEKCFDSTKMQKELLVSVGEKVYLALPWYQGLQPGHCMIIPSQHSTCCTQIDEDTWAEVNDFRKALTRMFSAQRKDVIFFEIANRLYKRPHLVIHCIPIKESDGEMAPFYFKKAIEESEHEWCVNKQLVSLRNKSLRGSIPKGLPYFWVNFGMDTGFAHVIEEEERFPVNFAQEIIGGMLNLDANKWRRLQKEQNIITKVKMFADWWKKYDCTK